MVGAMTAPDPMVWARPTTCPISCKHTDSTPISVCAGCVDDNSSKRRREGVSQHLMLPIERRPPPRPQTNASQPIEWRSRSCSDPPPNPSKPLLFMGFLPRNSFSISHLSKLSPIPTPNAQPSPSTSPPRSPPPLPKELMGANSSGGGSGSEEGEDESAEDLERILLSLGSSSDDEMEAPPFAVGDAGDGWAWDDGGFLELRDLGDGEFEGEGVVEEEAEELGDGEVVDGDGVVDDFGFLESELMEVDDSMVGLEEVVRS